MSKNAKQQLRKVRDESRKANKPKASKPAPHPVLSLEQRLRSMITGLLGGPGGDPDKHHMLAAAHCVLLLEQIGKPYKDDETLSHLKGESIHRVDFLELAKEDAAL